MVENMKITSKDTLRDAAGIVQTNIQSALTDHSHPAGTKTPSPPGSFPGSISGRLRSSVRVTGPHGGGGTWEAEVGPTTKYGRIQELGGIAGRGAKLPPRPYVLPMLLDSIGFIHRIFYSAWSATWTTGKTFRTR
jgi:phage gpG-like protein